MPSASEMDVELGAAPQVDVEMGARLPARPLLRCTTFYSAEEVARHNTLDDLWIVIQGKVYDVTKWIEKHPGGTAPLTYGGKDVTNLFTLIHNKGVLERHQDLVIGSTDVAVASYDLNGAKSKSTWYDTQEDPLGYDDRQAGGVSGMWGAGREFGDRMAKESETSNIPKVVIVMYLLIASWSALAYSVASAPWWSMLAFYAAGQLAFYAWHRMAHSDWTGEMHDCHMEHHLIRFPPSDFYGSAESFATMYPNGMPTIWTLMNFIRFGGKTTSSSSSSKKHTPFIHEGPLFAFMFLILLGAHFIFSVSLLTLLFAFTMYAAMGIVLNAFHMSFHIRGFHLEKYEWYLELRALHYIHHLGDMEHNFGMVNMGFETMFATLAIEDPALNAGPPPKPTIQLPEGITGEQVGRVATNFGANALMIGMKSSLKPLEKRRAAVKRGLPTVALRLGMAAFAGYLWYTTEAYFSSLPATPPVKGREINDPVLEYFAWSEGAAPELVMMMCGASMVISELTIMAAIAASIFGTTFRTLGAIIQVFLIRFLILFSGGLSFLEVPDNLWLAPSNMPKLFVQGEESSHLFFSGRVAMAALACIELMNIGLFSKNEIILSSIGPNIRPFLACFGVFLLLWTVWLSLALKVSWSFDCLIAIIVAKYSVVSSARWCKVWDAWLP